MADDEELYDSAIATEETPAEETPTEPTEAKEERPRDEQGRFIKAESEEPVEEVQEPEPQEEPEPEEKKTDHRIPLTELLNERERRQAEQRRAEALAAEIENLRRQIQPPQVQTPPDQFQDPEGYNRYWEQRFAEQNAMFQQSIRGIQAENSLARAHDKHGDVFEKAYNAVLERASQGDRMAAQMIVNSPNPGEAMVGWYKRESALSTVGDDPVAYTEKVLEEALNNPEFLARAIEKARGTASAQPTQVKIPPSLNKATSAARSDDMGATSDAAMYHHAIGR